jgi:hypothetical protein
MQPIIPEHPRILNYTKGNPVIPESLKTGQLTLLLGAGDMVHTVTNVEEFSQYDMLICRPYDHSGSFYKNVEMLSETSPVLCCMNAEVYPGVPSDIPAFVSHFSGRFSKIDGHGHHVPHFSLDTLEHLLAENGTASNIFELSSGIVHFSTFMVWIENEYINAYSNIHMSTSKVISNGAMTLNDDDSALLRDVLQKRIIYLQSVNKNIHLSEEVLVSLPSYSHSTLQKIFGSMLFDSICPLSLLGSVCMHCPSWDREPSIQLVLTKSTPLFWENMLQRYKDVHGMNEHATRADQILSAIKVDIANYSIWQSKAKYATFLKHMRKNILPFVEA